MVYRGGHKVGKGTYWGIMDGERIEVEREGALPGAARAVYVKAPAFAVLLLAPALGLLYAVFLPFIGIAMTLVQAGRKIGKGLSGAAAKSLTFGWRPVEAYLTGRRRSRKAAKAKAEEAGGGKRS